MSEFNFSLMKKLSELAGAPGFEDHVRAFIQSELKDVVDEFRTDQMGNLYAIRKGESSEKKVMSAAHMDEIGFIVRHVDKSGFIRFQTLGGFDPKTLTAQRVFVHGKKDLVGVMGCKPIHVMSPEERAKPAKIDDYFIDLGMPAEQVHELVTIGDPITRERELIEMGDCVNGKSLDNRVACFVLMETLKGLKGKKIPYDFYAVFTTQEEVGIRGAQVATLEIKPTFSFCLDITLAIDTPGSKEEEFCTRLGQGPAIKVMDSSTICDRRLVAYMKSQAKKADLPYQLEILAGGGTDTAGMQRMTPGGSIAGCISIPCRHVHQVVETSHKRDVNQSVELLRSCVENLGEFDFEGRV